MDGVPRKNYNLNKEDLQKVVLHLENTKMGLNQISVIYSDSKRTVSRHARKRNKISNGSAFHKGRPTIFNTELENIPVIFWKYLGIPELLGYSGTTRALCAL